MAIARSHRPEPVTPSAPDRLAEFAGRTFRIPANCSIAGALDVDEHHALVVMRRQVRSKRPSVWPRAITLRVFREAGAVWVQRARSVTVPVDQVPALIAALAQVEETK